MKIAVTGSTGFIGTHLLPTLLSHGHQVIVLVEPGVQAGFREMETHVADVCTGEGLAAGLAGADGVIHLAARNHV
ncbi:MAG: NAD(P)-dependent oxidoreductase, partial [Syntrophobacterales bacterium]